MMWELIEKNRRRSVLLVTGLTLILVLLGAFLGALAGLAYAAEGLDTSSSHSLERAFGRASESGGLSAQEQYWVRRGAMSGAVGGLAVAAVLFLFAYFLGGSVLLESAHAKEISHEVHPVLFNVAEEMRIAAALPFRPKLYVMDEKSPNAFAAGIRSKDCAVAVTVGLLTQLNRDELQGVIAHEISHIMNRDVLFMTLSASMLGSIQLISDLFLRGFRLGASSSSRYRSSRSSNSGGYLILLLLALLVSALCALAAKLFYFAISRQREYLADACGARLTRYPEGLASALEKISASAARPADANAFTAASFIINPLDANERGAFSDLTSTHPPAEDRIRILRRMTQGASFEDYAKAYAEVRKGRTKLFPASTLKSKEPLALRQASLEAASSEKAPAEVTRDFGDLCAAVNGFAFFKCLCGLRFKIPPDFKEKKVPCPRCGLVNELPFMGPIGRTAAAAPEPRDTDSGKAAAPGPEPQIYKRKQPGWESFFCSCGRMIQLSPSFHAPKTECRFCRQTIHIDHSALA